MPSCRCYPNEPVCPPGPPSPSVLNPEVSAIEYPRRRHYIHLEAHSTAPRPRSSDCLVRPGLPINHPYCIHDDSEVSCQGAGDPNSFLYLRPILRRSFYKKRLIRQTRGRVPYIVVQGLRRRPSCIVATNWPLSLVRADLCPLFIGP